MPFIYEKIVQKGASMKKLFRLIVLMAILLMTACSGDDHASPNPAMGTWAITFSGAYTGSGSLSIDSDGLFDFTVTLATSSDSSLYRIKGKVTYSGEGQNDMSGDILSDTTIVAHLYGEFDGLAGWGTVSNNALIGTWTAEKTRAF